LKIKCEKCKNEWDLEQFDNEPSITDGYRTGSVGSVEPEQDDIRKIACPSCGNQLPVPS